MLLWGSAHHDERQFEHPEGIDLDRSNLNAHLGFGMGIHHFIDADSRRLEARIAIERVLPRSRAIGPASEQLRPYVQSVLIRRLEPFEIEVEAA